MWWGMGGFVERDGDAGILETEIQERERSEMDRFY